MKNGRQFRKYTLMIMLLALTALSIYLAFFLYRHYAVIARGISGLTLVLLLFFFGRQANLDVPLDDLWVDSKKSKFIISALVAPFLFWFGFAQIYELILFVLR
jgi:ABC-type arginine transport system permease subunit